MRNPKATAAITALIHAERPDWSEPGIRAAIVRMLDEHPAAAVVQAAIHGAANLNIRTPGALPLPGAHWPATPAQPAAEPGAWLGPLPECADCGQPAKRGHEPRRCPGCGQPWQARDWGNDLAGHGLGPVTQTCPDCGHTQRGRFPRCGSCGAEIPAEPGAPRPPLPRTHLDDPVPLAQAVGEWAATQETP